MRKIFGWVLLIAGVLVLGMVLISSLFNEQPLITPIPDKEEIRVIMLSPEITKP